MSSRFQSVYIPARHCGVRSDIRAAATLGQHEAPGKLARIPAWHGPCVGKLTRQRPRPSATQRITTMSQQNQQGQKSQNNQQNQQQKQQDQQNQQQKQQDQQNQQNRNQQGGNQNQQNRNT
jgi:hypothetical protein